MARKRNRAAERVYTKAWWELLDAMVENYARPEDHDTFLFAADRIEEAVEDLMAARLELHGAPVNRI